MNVSVLVGVLLEGELQEDIDINLLGRSIRHVISRHVGVAALYLTPSVVVMVVSVVAPSLMTVVVVVLRGKTHWKDIYNRSLLFYTRVLDGVTYVVGESGVRDE